MWALSERGLVDMTASVAGSRKQPFALWEFSPGVAGLALAVPTFIELGQQVWSVRIGAHGPIVLATGIWILWRQMPSMLRNSWPLWR